MDPRSHSFDHVARVTVDIDIGGTAEGAKSFDHGSQLHPVVCRGARCAGKLAPLPAIRMDEDGGPSPGAGVALTGAVRVEKDPVWFFSGRGYALSS